MPCCPRLAMSARSKAAHAHVLLAIVFGMTVMTSGTGALAQEFEVLFSSESEPIRLIEYASPDDCDANCESQAGVYANIEFLFARAHFKESFDGSTIDFVTGTQNLHPYSFDYSLSPRAALGFRTGEGLGLRATWWGYDDEAKARSRTATLTQIPMANVVSVIFPAAIAAIQPGEVLNTSTAVKAHSVDIEGTLDLSFGATDVSLGGGVRLAWLEQRNNAHVLNGANVVRSLDWTRDMQAAGPTIGIDGRRPFLNFGSSQVAAFGGLQGSLVLGENVLQRVVFGDVTPAVTATPPRILLDGGNEISGIFDMALGIEWSRDFATLGRGFVRGQYDTQIWTAAGSPTLSYLGIEGFGLTLGWER